MPSTASQSQPQSLIIRPDGIFFTCPYPGASDTCGEMLCEAFLRVDGGIIHSIWRQPLSSPSDPDSLADTLRSEGGAFSPRPYTLGQPCDGSITECVHALLFDWCSRASPGGGHGFYAGLLTAVGRRASRNTISSTLAIARWQGVTTPPVWDEQSLTALLESLTAINDHELRSAVQAAAGITAAPSLRRATHL